MADDKSEGTDFEDFHDSDSIKDSVSKPDIELKGERADKKIKEDISLEKASLKPPQATMDAEELKKRRDELMSKAIEMTPEEEFGVLDKVFNIPIIS